MKLMVLLCDRAWNVSRVLRDDFATGLVAGASLADAVSPDEARELRTAQNLECGQPLVRPLTLPGQASAAPAFAVPFHEHFLVIASQLEAPGDLNALAHQVREWLAWAQDNLPLPYQDGYYRIQRMNNRLLNAERALAKKSSQLERMLEEVREANNVVALLERDRLTGLYSSAGFMNHARIALQALPGDRYDVMVFAIVGLRQVRELFGNHTADDVVRAVALFVGELPNAQQVVFARIDSETFYALAPSNLQFSQTLHKNLNAYLSDYPLPATLHAVVGVCAGSAKESPAEEACNRARMAFDQACASKTDIAFYDQALLRATLREHRIIDAVPQALAQGQFCMYLQSKVDMRTGEVVGAEALVRWVHPKFGLISPADFVPLLEKHDRIWDVDRFIWEQACKMQQKRRRRGLRTLPISVNVARSDFYKPQLCDELCGLRDSYGLERGDVRLEVIERAYARDSEALSKTLLRLRDAGFVLEMDDFGTGESTLAMLSDMPIDVLKLDRSFVARGLEDKRRRVVVANIVRMANELGMTVIAEGVETPEQERYLLELGCTYAQGFLYAKPQPADYFLKLE